MELAVASQRGSLDSLQALRTWLPPPTHRTSGLVSRSGRLHTHPLSAGQSHGRARCLCDRHRRPTGQIQGAHSWGSWGRRCGVEGRAGPQCLSAPAWAAEVTLGQSACDTDAAFPPSGPQGSPAFSGTPDAFSFLFVLWPEQLRHGVPTLGWFNCPQTKGTPLLSRPTVTGAVLSCDWKYGK